MPGAPASKKIDAILVLLDVVEYTPQSRREGGTATFEFDQYLKDELTKRAEACGFHYIKPIGDAALLWGTELDGLVRLMLDLFLQSPVREYKGFQVRLRMLAHKAYFTFSLDGDRVADVHGPDAILLFRLEKLAHLNRVVVTPNLFAGLRDDLKRPNGLRDDLDQAGILAHEIELPEQLKGLGPDSPRKVWLLTPPLAAETRDQELPAVYREARQKLYGDVQFIPVFAGLYDPIPMGESFLNLSLDLSRTSRMGYLRFTAPDFEPRLEMRSDDDARHGEDDPARREPRFDSLSANDLFERVPVGVIAGLPGAGKTTILRHFAWLAFERDSYAVVAFVEAKYLDDEHLAAYRKSPHDCRPEEVFRILAAVTLYQGTLPAKFTDAERKAVEDTAIALRRAWEENRALLLLDALDECRTSEVRAWLGRAAIRLMTPFSKSEEHKGDGPLPPGRCYLSLRVAELDSPDPVVPTDCDLFLVNSLDQEQVRAIARRRYGGYENPLYRAFDDQIWRRRDIQRIVGTPLTAMLMVFFFEFEQRFARRHPTYRLIVLFILDRAWNRLKNKDFSWGRLNPFFQEALHPDYLARRPELALQYAALSYSARRMLYHRPGNADNTVRDSSRRAISREELRTYLELALQGQQDFIQQNGLPASDIAPAQWIKAWTSEHLFIPAGAEELVFLHSTVLEYLAAENVAELLSGIQPGEADAELKKVFDQREHDVLETLPILCSRDHGTGWRVLKRLTPQPAGLSPEFAADSTLPFRCLAELEAAERDYLAYFRDSDLRLVKQREVDDRPEKDWAYLHLRRYVLALEVEPEPERQQKLEQRGKEAEKLVPLCRQTLPLRYLHDWRNDGEAVALRQGELLSKMMEKPAWEAALAAGFQGLPLVPAPVVPPRLEEYLAVTEKYRGSNFLRRVRGELVKIRSMAGSPNDMRVCDETGNPQDRNLAYSRASYSLAIVGGYGSPNFRHGRPVCCIAISPDGLLALSGSDDGRLIIWHLDSGREVRSLLGHRTRVTSCAFSPDGRRVLSGSSDKTLKLWDTNSGVEVRSFLGHKESVDSCAFSPDGRRVLSGSWDKTLKLWDADSGVEVRSFLGHTASVMSCAFSPDGRRVLSGLSDKALKLWDADSGVEIRSFLGHTASVIACAFSPDGRYVLSGSSDTTLKLWDTNSGVEVHSFLGHRADVRSCAFSPDGRRVLSASQDKTLKLWDVGRGVEVRSFLGHTASIYSCAFSPDDRRVLSGSQDKTLKLWDAHSGVEVRSFLGHTASIYSCAFSPDGRRVLSGSDDNTLELWDADSGVDVRSFLGHTASVWSCVFSPDGRRVLSGSSDKILKLWDADSGVEVRSFLGHTAGVMSCAFGPDGRRVLSGSMDKTLKLWDTNSGVEVRSFLGHTASVMSCAFSPDGRRVLSGSWDKSLKLWDVESGVEVRSFLGHKDRVHSCAFSPDGRFVLSASQDKTLKLWDADSGVEVCPFLGHSARIWSCVFSPDGCHVLSGSQDRTLKLWSVETGKKICSWNLGWPVWSTSIHPNQPNLAVAALQNGVLLLIDLNVRNRPIVEVQSRKRR